MIYTLTLNPAVDKTILVEKIKLNMLSHADQTIVNCGGKGFNVSRALKMYAINSVAIGFVGGSEGEFIENVLQNIGIDIDLIHITGNTRTNYVVSEKSGQNHIKINERGPQISSEDIHALILKVETLAKPGDYWILSGSIPLGVRNSIYADLVNRIHAKQGYAILDTSGEPMKLGVLEQPDLIKPNLEEFEELTNSRMVTIESMVQHIMIIQESHHIKRVALSLGSQGLILSDSCRTVHSPAPQVEVRNPTGAGDALLAGIIWSRIQGFTLEQTAAWGVAAGTASAAKIGTDFCTIKEIEPYYQTVLKTTIIL